MGVCDYTDFVYDNGQDLESFDLLDEGVDDTEEYRNSPERTDGCAGFGTAILVFIPDTFTKGEIERMPLPNFAQFETEENTYNNWNNFEFSNHPDYADELARENSRIWSSENKPGYWIINFVPDIYKIFVTNEISYERLPMYIYEIILDHRGIDLRTEFPSLNKQEIFDFLCYPQ